LSGESGTEVRTHTALHVVKGALVRVLGEQALLTTSTWVRGKRGRITVTAREKPSDERMREVEEQANAIIDSDVEIQTYVLPRDEAEALFGDYIYDAFPVPPGVRELSVIIIQAPDGSLWNINACNKRHTPTTGAIGRIRLVKYRYRPSRGQLEVTFELEHGTRSEARSAEP